MTTPKAGLAAILVFGVATVAACSGGGGNTSPTIPQSSSNAVAPNSVGQNGNAKTILSGNGCTQSVARGSTGPGFVVTPNYSECGGDGGVGGTGGGGNGPGGGGTGTAGGNCSQGGGCGLLNQPCTSDPTQTKCEPVAEATGPPKQGDTCQQTDGANSLAVGATVGAVNSQPRSVVDINQIDTGANNTIVNSNTIASGLTAVGWLYLDNGGGRWFQKDPNSSWTIGISVNVNSFFGFSFTPGNFPPIPEYVSKQLVTPITNNLVDIKCFTQGTGLSPGSWG